MDGISLSPAELGLVGFVVIAAGVLVWRVFEKATREMAENREAFFGEKSPVRELVDAVRALHAELVVARRERGDPTPVSAPYALHRPKVRGGEGGG